MRRFLAFVDKLSGARADLDPEVLTRVRFLFSGAVPAAVISALACVVDLLRGKWGNAAGGFLGALSCVVLMLTWRRTRSLLVCAHVAAAYDALLFIFITAQLGDPTLMAWLVVPGYLAMLLGGWRAGAAWVPVTLLASIVMALLFMKGVIPLGAEVSVLERIWRVAPMPPVMLAIGVLFESSRNRLLHEAREAQQTAERAQLARRRFLASVSHEIRTPLNGVLGMTDLLLAGPLEPSLRESLGVIHSSGATLRALINDLLDLSSAEAGKLTLAAEPFEVSAPLRAVVSLTQAQAKGLTLTVRDELPPGLRVVGDPLRLGQVLSNLLHNAVKFTTEGSVTIAARATQVATGWALDFEVTDTGSGLSAQQSAQLFQPFSQLENARGRGGTGLGLVICRELVEKMKGELTLDSAVGVGSTFRVRLTLPAAPPLVPTTPLAVLPSFSGRALVVDDNVINARVARGMLERLGFVVESAGDGEEALRRLEGGRFDLVLMDCEMPLLDGLDATREWRRREGPVRRVPIIALTANAARENLEACLAAGMDGHLTKPVQLQALSGALTRCRIGGEPAAEAS